MGEVYLTMWHVQLVHPWTTAVLIHLLHVPVCPLYPTEENGECIDVSNIAIYNIGRMMS